MNCQRCQSTRVANLTAKATDCCSVTIAEVDSGAGEVPGDMGVGGGDYVEVAWCLDCGQMQGEWALPPCELERDPEEPACPGEDCPRCSGESCGKCGAGNQRDPSTDGRECDHDSAERHEEPES